MVGPLMVFTIKFKRFFIHVSSILGPQALVNKILDLFEGHELVVVVVDVASLPGQTVGFI